MKKLFQFVSAGLHPEREATAGCNHLFLLDMHWNPQLENQACDRIYRVGQKREVKIHR